jgi:Chaperone of endosialidase
MKKITSILLILGMSNIFFLQNCYCQKKILSVKGGAIIDSGLTVNSSFTFLPVGAGGILNERGAGTISGTFVLVKYALLTNGSIICNGSVYATSDARIKSKILKSDSQKDLEVLSKIIITEYLYKDTITNGIDNKKGVIAQDVDKIFPQAISKRKEFIPNIYKIAKNVTIKNDTLIVELEDSIGMELKIGDKIRLFTEIGEKQCIVSELHDTKIISSDWNYGKISSAFVFGKEVNDLRVVDYNQLFMLNISATQELLQKNKSNQDRLLSIEEENKALKARLLKLENSMEAMLISIKSEPKTSIIGGH